MRRLVTARWGGGGSSLLIPELTSGGLHLGGACPLPIVPARVPTAGEGGQDRGLA